MKYYVYREINKKLQHKIEFRNISLGIFPLAINVKNLTEFPIKDKNLVSFKKVRVEIPFFSLFSTIKSINLYIHEPKVIFDNTLLKKGRGGDSLSGFEINKVNIIDGELIYNTPNLYVNLVKFNLLSFPQDNFTVYRLTSPHLKAIFPFSGKQVRYEGQVICEARKERSSWKISKIVWETPFVTWNVNGRIYQDHRMALNVYGQGSFRQILDPLLGEFSIHEFMYGNFKIKGGKEGRVSAAGDLNINAFTCGGESFKDLRGTLAWDNTSNRVLVNTRFHDNNAAVNLRVEAQNRVVRLSAQNLSAAKVTRIIDIDKPLPLGGIIKKGDITIHHGLIEGTVELKPEKRDPLHADPHEFRAGGLARFTYDTQKKAIHVSAPDIQTEFGQLTNLQADITPNENTELYVDFQSSIKESAFLDKYSTFYINLPLKQWKLSGGNGGGKLHLEKIKGNFFITSDLWLRDFYSSGEKISALKGRIQTEKEITTGVFNAYDKDLQGEAQLRLNSKTGSYTLRFDNLQGESRKLLNILEINLDLQGRARGDFTYSNNTKKPAPLLTGPFLADNLRFYGFGFEKVRGNLTYEQNRSTIILKDLKAQYRGGKGSANVVIDYKQEQYDVGGHITGIDLNRMNNEFKGTVDIDFSGRGRFEQDSIALTLRTGDVYFYQDQSFRVKGEGKVITNFSDHYYLDTGVDIIHKDSSSPVSLRLNQVKGRYDGRFHGDITDINFLIPWGNNQGEITVDGRIFNRSTEEMGVEGRAVFKGKYLSFPNFPHTIDDFQGDLLFNDLHFTLRSLQGTLGDGPVECQGKLDIAQNRVENLSMSLTGENMNLHILDRTECNLDANLTLRYLGEKLLFSGDLNINSGLWEREVDEGVSFNTNTSLSSSGSTFLGKLEYDLRMISRENVQVRNSLGEMTGKLNLRLTGNYDFPVLTGIIESNQGFINFSGKQFDLIKAKLNYSNKFLNDPEVDIESETYIKNYRIKFTIKGFSSKLIADLQSSPPLPTRDIFTLISVGELFKRPTSSEIINEMGSGTTDLIATELTEQIKKRTKKFLGDYVLTIDPNINTISGTTDTSRIIVGKEILKDFLIVYSTDFSTQRQEVIYVQYQLSPTISVIGMRNEAGLFSIDLRVRNRKQR